MVTSEQVREALKNRHAGDSWAYFEELRTHTGNSSESRSSLGYLDAYAIGLWKDNRGFIAYEIKQTRGDFMSDIEKFATKQAAALRNSTQFYYICPANLISPDEVPVSCGLMWVDGGGAKVKKIAPIRELKDGSLDPDFCRAMFRAKAERPQKTTVWKYLGKELTQEDLLKLAQELGHLRTGKNIEREVTLKAAKVRQRSWGILKKFAEAINYRALGYSDSISIEDVANQMVEAYRKSQQANFIANNIICGAKQIRKAADDLMILVQKQETQGVTKDVP
jgi:hypothetical protein